MFDSEDLGDILFIFFPTSWPSFILWLIIAAVGYTVVSCNEDKCAQLQCASGQHAELIHNQCACIEALVGRR